MRKEETITHCNTCDIIIVLADYVPDHYKHAIRQFGLLSPRTRAKTFGVIFAQVRQVLRQEPLMISLSLMKDLVATLEAWSVVLSSKPTLFIGVQLVAGETEYRT